LLADCADCLIVSAPAGDIVFFNKLAKGNCKQMGSTRSGSSVTAAWSPCGRYFLTATTAPRLRVDNNIRVFNYVGEHLCRLAPACL
jgi:translation initiation factor 2A